MRFGLFGGAQADAAAGAPEGQSFHDYIEFNVEADALGYCPKEQADVRADFLT